MRKFRIVPVFLAAMLSVCTVSVSADEESDVRNMKEAAEAQLGDTEQALYDLALRQQEIQSQITSMNADLVDLMVQIEQARTDISDTEAQITVKNRELFDTQRSLRASESVRDRQYEDMKKRIQYIYERGGQSGLAYSIFDSRDLSSMLNKADYAADIHDADRTAFQGYIDTVSEIGALEKQQQQEKKDLEDTRENLKKQELYLSYQEAELAGQIEEKKRTDDQYAWQIEEAQKLAQEISSLINEQQQRLNEIESEKQAAAEAAASAAAAAEAARTAAQSGEDEAVRVKTAREAADKAEEAARQAEAMAENAGSDATREAAAQARARADEARAAAEKAEADKRAADEAREAQERAAEEARRAREQAGTPIPPENCAGESIVAYARQFVGRPYVWGGGSLMYGCDCSHFVWLVLRDCGAYGGGYTTSGGWAGLGSPVGSLAEARAGDVIVYSGHVAIYDGNGCLVEAQSSAAGITNYRSAACKPIVAIRRFTRF